MARFTLTDDEVKAIGAHSKRHGFIAVIEWFDGPRGGRFRPMRTISKPTRVEAEREAAAVVATRNADARTITIHRVNAAGRVLEAAA